MGSEARGGDSGGRSRRRCCECTAARDDGPSSPSTSDPPSPSSPSGIIASSSSSDSSSRSDAARDDGRHRFRSLEKTCQGAKVDQERVRGRVRPRGRVGRRGRGPSVSVANLRNSSISSPRSSTSSSFTTLGPSSPSRHRFRSLEKTCQGAKVDQERVRGRVRPRGRVGRRPSSRAAVHSQQRRRLRPPESPPLASDPIAPQANRLCVLPASKMAKRTTRTTRTSTCPR
jgi:hypothetical protein